MMMSHDDDNSNSTDGNQLRLEVQEDLTDSPSSHWSERERDVEHLDDVFKDDEGSVLAGSTTTRGRRHVTIALGSFAAAVVLLIVILVVALRSTSPHSTSSTGSDSEKMTPSTSSRDPQERMAIQRVLTRELGYNYFGDATQSFPHQARRMALHWILEKDPTRPQATDHNLLQRFILHVLYFQTTRYFDWEECNPADADQNELCYYPTGGFNGEDPSKLGVWGHRWLSPPVHECWWAGIVCDSDTKQVKSIRMEFNDLNGPIPTELVKLSALSDLTLSTNQLSGTIPTELGSLSTLAYLRLEENQLTGTIPSELTSFPLLEVLSLSSNRLSGTLPAAMFSANHALTRLSLYRNFLTGTIPTEVGLFRGWQLDLGINYLSGTIPVEFFSAVELRWLYMENNTKLTGPLPSELGLLANVTDFFIGETDLTGFIPTEIGLLTQLVILNMTETGVRGTLPEEFYQLEQLLSLDISKCQLSGSISSSVGKLTDLALLHISHNQFTGSLPTELELLTTLQSLEINGNALSGSIPNAICAQADAQHWVDYSVVADCMPDPGSGTSLIVCPEDCCTTCCSSESGFCTSKSN